MKESDAKPELSRPRPPCIEPATQDGGDRQVTLRFCESNLAEQPETRRIREALRQAPPAFLAHVRIQDVRCADRCKLCDLGPMVVIGEDAMVPATLQKVVDEVTRRVAPERLKPTGGQGQE